MSKRKESQELAAARRRLRDTHLVVTMALYLSHIRKNNTGLTTNIYIYCVYHEWLASGRFGVGLACVTRVLESKHLGG